MKASISHIRGCLDRMDWQRLEYDLSFDEFKELRSSYIELVRQRDGLKQIFPQFSSEYDEQFATLVWNLAKEVAAKCDFYL